VYRRIWVPEERLCSARVPTPLPGMEEVNHKPVDSLVPSFSRMVGSVKAGRVASSAATLGVVMMEMPRPDAKAVLV
jgi:hypothetical protein